MATKFFPLFLTASPFGVALAYLLAGAVFVIGGLITTRLLAPNRPNEEKLSTYECGEEPVGTSWVQFNMRFYVMGLIFLIFDVEILLLFPWATVYADPALIALSPNWGIVATLEALIFILILLLGLAYVWERKDIDWIRPEPLAPESSSPVVAGQYAAVNERFATTQLREPKPWVPPEPKKPARRAARKSRSSLKERQQQQTANQPTPDNTKTPKSRCEQPSSDATGKSGSSREDSSGS